MGSSHSPPATRRSTSSRLARLALACAGAAVLAAAPIAARADDGASVERGRSLGRVVLLLRNPAACSIALLRARCRVDVDALFGKRTDADFASIPHIGPHPLTGLRALIDDGDQGAFDRALAYMNTIASPPELWTSVPRDAALVDAGIEDVLYPSSRGNAVAQLLNLGPVLDLAGHVAQIPDGALPLDPAPLRTAGGAPANAETKLPAGVTTLPAGATAYAHDLLAALDARYPPPAIMPRIHTPDARAVALMGVASTTLANLIDTPAWLAQNDAQRFVEDYLVQMGPSVSPGTANELRARTRADASFDHGRALAAATEAGGVYVHGLPRNRAQAYLVGLFAAQLPFNAAVLRDPGAAAGFLRFLAQSPEADAAVPGFAAVRSQAATIGRDDWKAQYRLGVQLVDLLTKGGPS